MEKKQIGNYTVVSDGGVPFGLIHHHYDGDVDLHGVMWSFSPDSTSYDEAASVGEAMDVLQSVLYPEMENPTEYFKLTNHKFSDHNSDVAMDKFEQALTQMGIANIIEALLNNEGFIDFFGVGCEVLRTDSNVTFRAAPYIWPPDSLCIYMEAQKQAPGAFYAGPVVATGKFEWNYKLYQDPASEQIRLRLVSRVKELLRRRYS